MKRIIIVEKDFIIALALKKGIQRLGHEVTAILDNGKAAIAKVKQGAVDLVLMEIRLFGEIDGIEAMNHIRKISDVPVIFLTGNTDESTKKRAMETNPAGFLIKPLQKDTLKEIFRKTVGENQNNN